MIDLAALTQAVDEWDKGFRNSERIGPVVDAARLVSRLWQPCQTCGGTGQVHGSVSWPKRIKTNTNTNEPFACPSCGGVGVEPTPLLHDLTHKLMSDIADPSKTVRVDEFALALWRVANEETD